MSIKTFHVEQNWTNWSNVRLHATLQQRPLDLWRKEQPHLQALPPTPYAGFTTPTATLSTAKLVMLPNIAIAPQHDLAIYQQCLYQPLGETGYELST